jgi:tetratricopeptide (TPR) repeat protein
MDASTRLDDGPWGAIDGQRTTRWDCVGATTRPHRLVLELEQPCAFADNDELVIALECKSGWPHTRLGCFRLSLSGDDRAAGTQLLCAVLGDGSFSPFESLAAWHLARGDAAAVLDRLKPGPSDDTSTTTVSRLLRAMALQQLGETEAARKVVDQLLDSAALEPPPRVLHGAFLEAATRVGGRTRREIEALVTATAMDVAQLNRAIAANPTAAAGYHTRGTYLTRLGRWREAAADHAHELRLSPEDRSVWQQVAVNLALAGDESVYRQHCRAMMTRFREATDVPAAIFLCKFCLLSPDAVEPSALPVQKLRDVMTDPALEIHRPYASANGALVFYREGQYREAVAWAQKAASLKGFLGRLALVVRAMAEEKLGHHEDAVKSLADAEASIPEELSTLGTPVYTGTLPIPDNTALHQWQFNEILRREASLLIHHDVRRRANPASLRRQSVRLACLGRWSEAAHVALDEVALKPGERTLFAWSAALLALAGDDEGYRKLRAQMIAQFCDSATPEQAESVCKVCLLLPGRGDRSSLPAQTLRDALEQKTGPAQLPAWGYGCLALVAYRDGAFAQAVQWSEKSFEFNGKRGMPGALALVVLSMAQHQLNETEPSRQSLSEAAALIPAPLATLGQKDFEGPLPVSPRVVNADWLIAEVLRREAAALSKRPPEPRSGR